MTSEEYINECKNVHGDKYDYSKVNVTYLTKKVCIICPKHGEFYQDYYHHVLRKQGCIKCRNELSSKNQSLGTSNFIKRAKEVHGDKYDYSKVEYKNLNTKVCIICPIHGEFYQTPNNHLSGKNCLYCRGNNISLSKRLGKDEFLKRAKEVHGDKYDYSKVEYKNLKTCVKIICPEHGEFLQSPDMHIGRGEGCPMCARKKLAQLQYVKYDEFLKRAKETHGDMYDYIESTYHGMTEKVDIICKKHGKFSQLASNHVAGKGCPICNLSKLELSIKNFLDDNNIEYEQQKTFDWLKNETYLKLDFYLPKYNLGIECQGIQHFKEINYYGGTAGLEQCQFMDNLKFNLCKNNNLKLIYYTDIILSEYPYFVYTNKEEMLQDIINSTDGTV